jgi:serine/threonine-protein kinase ATR
MERVERTAASMDSYERAYPYLVRLHMLRELEQSLTLLQSFHGGEVEWVVEKQALLADWEHRLALSQPTLKSREAILNLRAVPLPRHTSSIDCV